MKLYSSDAGEVVDIERFEVNGGKLLIHGRIFGAMPMTAQLRPEEVRKGLKQLGVKNVLFLLVLLFLPASQK